MPIAALIPPRGASRQAPLKMADQKYGRARRDSNVQTIYSRRQASSCAMQLQAQRIARWRLANGDIIVLYTTKRMELTRKEFHAIQRIESESWRRSRSVITEVTGSARICLRFGMNSFQAAARCSFPDCHSLFN